jgi:hypothetical protein
MALRRGGDVEARPMMIASLETIDARKRGDQLVGIGEDEFPLPDALFADGPPL